MHSPFLRLSGVGVLAFVAITCGRESQTITSPRTEQLGGIAMAKGETGRSLSLAVAPGGAVEGQTFTTQPQVEFRSSKGKLLPVGELVTASLIGTDVALGGTTSVRAKSGSASFTDLSIGTPGTYTIRFSAPGADAVDATLVVAPACNLSGTLVDAGVGMTVSGNTATIGDAGGTFSIDVTVEPSTCTWQATSDRSWITIDSPGAHTGSQTITYSVDVLAHASPVRSGTISLSVTGSATPSTVFNIDQTH